MDIIWFLHWLAPLSVILLPFLDYHLLKYIFWYPVIYYVLWIYFDGCPLNRFHNTSNKNNDDQFMLPIVKKYISKEINTKNFSRYIGLFICISIIMSAYKIIHNCNCH